MVSSSTPDMIRKKQSLILTLFFGFFYLQAFPQAQGELYLSVVSQADTYLSNGDLINAKASYQYASRLNPEAEYPKKKLGETLDKLRAKMAVVDEYSSVVAKADSLFRIKDYEMAKIAYMEATVIMNDESYPADRIAVIERIVNDQESKQRNYNAAVANGEKLIKYRKFEKAKEEFVKANEIFPTESYPKEKITELDTLIAQTGRVRQAYYETVASADRLFNLKYYENARQEYQKAFDAKPDEDYPSMKIAEIDDILSKKTDFDQLIVQGDEFYGNKNITEAKTKYQAALVIYPSEKYPKDMIIKINETLRSSGNLNDLYSKSVQDADGFLEAKDYINALTEYENAGLIKPAENYPKQKAEQVRLLMDKAETDLLEFNGAVQRGEQYLAIEDLANAKAEFEKAVILRPDAAYPKEKLKELKSKMDEIKGQQEAYDQIIAAADKLFQEGKYEQAKAEYEKAQKLKPEDTYPAERIAAIDKILTKGLNTEKEYKSVITQADDLFGNGKFEEANLQYMKASYLKPEEKYPKDRMAEIDSIVLAQKNIMAEYNKYIAAGDRWLEIKDYQMAKEKYSEAQKILPNEKYPRQKLVEIDSIVVLNEIAAQDIYNGLIDEGNKHFGKKEYEQAKIKFQNALKYKPEEGYPNQKINEIDSLVMELGALQAKYSVLISEADLLYTSKKYQDAKTKYIAASALLPDEQYPKTKIEEINLHFKTSNQQNQQAYDKAISDADKLFASGVLDQALDLYRNAKALNTELTYPDEMITRILTKLEENAIRNLLTETIVLENNTEKKLTFEPVLVSDRKSNYLFIKAKNLSDKEFKIVLSFGKGSTKNGGFVLPVPNQADEREFIVPIGKQYNWFSQDNDWINLYSQGGKVEVTTGKISKGD